MEDYYECLHHKKEVCNLARSVALVMEAGIGQLATSSFERASMRMCEENICLPEEITGSEDIGHSECIPESYAGSSEGESTERAADTESWLVREGRGE